ncbi:hypothetical protein A2U01_0051389, partial [Trifolium medium]|nr:hypothetical protein [Trifolium medium]
HIVEIHPPVTFGDLLHPWDKDDVREVNAPLLNNSLLQDGFVVLSLWIVKRCGAVEDPALLFLFGATISFLWSTDFF